MHTVILRNKHNHLARVLSNVMSINGTFKVKQKKGVKIMNGEIKENDIVKRISPTGTECVARVRWVNDKGEAGVTYITPDSYKGSAQVVAVEELEVIQESMGKDLKDVPTTDLIAAIKRLRGMRTPKKPATRRASTRKQSVKSKLDMLFEEGGDALDGLVARAIKEIKEEEKGGRQNGN